MSPYTSQNVKKRLIPPSRINKRNNSDEKRRVSEKLQPFDNTTDSIPNNIYHLTSVITHTGKIETGHYTCFVFHRGEWFLFDDHTITIASEKRVMAGNHYMLFYAKSNIGFSAVDAYEHARVINDL